MILPLVRRSGVASLHINVVSFGYVLWPSFSTTKGLIRKTLFLNHHYNGDFHGTQKGYLWCNIFRGVGWRRKRWWLVICSETFVLTFSNVNVFQDLRSCRFLSCTVVKSPVCHTETFSKNIFNIVQIKCVLSSHSEEYFCYLTASKKGTRHPNDICHRSVVPEAPCVQSSLPNIFRQWWFCRKIWCGQQAFERFKLAL